LLITDRYFHVDKIYKTVIFLSLKTVDNWTDF